MVRYSGEEYGSVAAATSRSRLTTSGFAAACALAAALEQEPPAVVSERLGHSTTAITADIYTHVMPTVGRAAAQRIAAESVNLNEAPSSVIY